MITDMNSSAESSILKTAVSPSLAKRLNPNEIFRRLTLPPNASSLYQIPESRFSNVDHCGLRAEPTAIEIDCGLFQMFDAEDMSFELSTDMSAVRP